jgi:predicted amidohydrolase
MEVAIVQFEPVFGDIEANIRQLDDLLMQAATCKLIVLPELASSGYNFADKAEALKYSEEISDSRFIDFLEQKASEMGCHIVAGMNERDGDRFFNSSVLVGPEGLMGVYRKLHLFAGEKKIFTPGDLGVEVYQTPIGKIGMLICFDWMFPEVWRMMALKGAQIVCHPCNLVLPYCQQAVASHALINRNFVVSANRIGTEGDLTFTGQSVICNPKGNTIVRGDDVSVQVLTSKVDVTEADNKWITPDNHIFYDRRLDVYLDLSE